MAGTGVWKSSSVACGFSSNKIDYSDYVSEKFNQQNKRSLCFFSIKYRYSDILLKTHKLNFSQLFCCNRTCYCVNMVSLTSASRYITSASRYITSVSRFHPRFQSRSSMYIRGLIPQNFAELAEAVPIVCNSFPTMHGI